MKGAWSLNQGVVSISKKTAYRMILSTAGKRTVKFQNRVAFQTTDVATLSFHEILRYDLLNQPQLL